MSFVLLSKSQPGKKIAHQAGYYLLNGRWHAISEHKTAPKGAPVAHHPEAAGSHVPAKHFTDDEWKQLELPAENQNAGTYNKQLAALKQMSESGHVTGIVGSGFGTNTYGKKLATIANHLLKLHGSQHQVTPGQKAGEHAAVNNVYSGDIKKYGNLPKDEINNQLNHLLGIGKQRMDDGQPIQQSTDKLGYAPPAGDGDNGNPLNWLTDDELNKFIELKHSLPSQAEEVAQAKANIAAKIAAKKEKLAQNKKISKPTEQGHVEGDKYVMPLDAAIAEHKELQHVAETPSKADDKAEVADQKAELAQMEAEKAAAGPALAMPEFVVGKKVSAVAYYQKQAQKVLDLAAAGDKDGLEKLKADGLVPNADGKVSVTWQGHTPNSKLLVDLYDKALQSLGGEPANQNPVKNEEPANAGASAPEPAPTSEPIKNEGTGEASVSALDKLVADIAAAKGDGKAANAAVDYIQANGNAAWAVSDAIDALQAGGFTHVAAKMSDIQKKNAEKTAPAPATSKLDQIPWDKMLLPDSNSNAKTHNGKVEKIKAMAYAGDIAGLDAFKAGKNTYGQKQMKLAATALAALKEGGSAAPATPAKKPRVVLATKKPKGENLLQGWVANTSSGKQPTKEQAEAYEALSVEDQEDLFHEAVMHHPDVLNYNETDGFDEVQDSTANLVQKLHQQALAGTDQDPGPKDGDTKPGADGMLVFKDGRWHKVEEPKAPEPAPAAPAPATGVDAVAVPDFEALSPGKYGTAYKKIAEALLAAVKADGLAGLKQYVTEHKKEPYAGTFTVKAAGMKLTKIGMNLQYADAQKAARQAALHKFINDLKAAAGKAPKKAKAPKPAATQSAAPTPAAPSLPEGTEPIDGWTQTGGQGGSNPGGKFKDPDGVEWYCKFPKDDDIAKSEVLAAKLYALAGVTGQDAKLITKGGKLGIASRWVDVSKASSPSALASVAGVKSGFAVDAWLGNWDVVGLGYDNLQIGADGEAVRVDAGGSLQYRAQGGKKAFGNVVTEIESLRDKNINPQAAAVFGDMTTADITASVKKVAAISDDDIYDLVMKYGPGDHENRANLVETLIERKNDLIAKFPKAVPKEKAKPKPDPTALKVDPSQLPQPHDFKNWKGHGNGLSSKAHVNEMNQKAEQDLLDFALKGNLIALKDYHYDAVDKETGASLGKKPIDLHPSSHVKLYWSDLVSALSFIAYPPEALKKFKTVVATSVKKVSDAFKSASYGMTTNKAEASSRLAFWIALGNTKPAETLLPPGSSLDFQSHPTGIPKMTDAMRQQAKAAYAALPSGSLVKRFINGIQSSGTYNDNFRDGKMVTSDGKDAVGMVLDAYHYASEKPEGFECYKWVSFSPDMAKQLMSAPTGTVFQNPGSMCCSYEPNATAGFGSDRMRIRYAKGAKAVDSFGSGNFSGEKEITTLPGQRFVILSCKKVYDPHKGTNRVELDVLMLPPDPTYVSELEAMKGTHGKVAA